MLGGRWEGLSRVSCLGSGKTDKLGTAKGKGGVDEDGAEPLKAVFERAWIVPVVSTKISTIDFGVDTSTVNNDGKNDETDDGCDLDDAENEFDC